MLPKTVADGIKKNKSTSEMFDSATILFSEIEDFNDIARSCNPLELFDMLDILYKTFDERIDRYDVYKVIMFNPNPHPHLPKVETINDSYMVASGLPLRNGDKHVSEVIFKVKDKTHFFYIRSVTWP